MNKTLIFVAILLTTAAFSNVSAQGDKDLRDTDVKGRSNELERVDRETKKTTDGKIESPVQNQSEDKLAAKYGDIKMDYEQIQMSQDSIIKAYQSGDKVDYGQISKFSQEINKSGMRLSSNLFPAPVGEETAAKKDEKPDKEIKKSPSVRELIIELDNNIGSFATSAMFQNLRVVDPVISEKARLNLEKIIELSGMLDVEAQKMATGK